MKQPKISKLTKPKFNFKIKKEEKKNNKIKRTNKITKINKLQQKLWNQSNNKEKKDPLK